MTGYYPSSFVLSFLPNEVIPLSMKEVKQCLGVIASPMQFSQEKDCYWIRQKKLGLYAYHPQKGHVSKQRNDNWVALPVGKNSISLSNLPKGEFELEVRTTDENGL